MKKKFFSFMLSLCLMIPCIFMLPACFETKERTAADIVGEYTVSEFTMSIDDGGEDTVTLEEYSALMAKSEQNPEELTMDESMELMFASMFFEQTWVFNEDGSYTVIVPEDVEMTEGQNGTWTLDGNVISLVAVDTEEVTTMNVNGTTLTMTYSMEGDSVTLVLNKK